MSIALLAFHLVIGGLVLADPSRADAGPPYRSTSSHVAAPPAPQTAYVENTLLPTAQNVGDTDLWIVSTRRCPQKSGARCVGCQFDHFHHTGNRCEFQKDAGAFRRWLKPGIPICVIVHGSFVSFEGLMTETRQMARWIRYARPNQPVQIVYFTWPSDGAFSGLFQVDIGALGHRSEFNGIYLAQFIASLPKQSPLCLIGHSHGARTVSSSLHLLGGGAIQDYRMYGPAECDRKIRVIYLAAALDHHWLNPGECYDRAFCPVEALLNVRNENDLALFFYPLRRPFSHRALARTGFTKNDLEKLGGNVAKIAELDVSRIVGHRHYWQYYFRRPEIARAVSPYIFFTDRQFTPLRERAVAVPPKPTPRAARWQRTRSTTVRTVTSRTVRR